MRDATMRALHGAALAFILLAPGGPRDINPDQPGYYGGNVSGSFDCWMIFTEDDHCTGGFYSNAGNTGDDPWWWVQCDGETCSAGVRCWDGRYEEGEGEYSCTADENALHCYDNGSSFPTSTFHC